MSSGVDQGVVLCWSFSSICCVGLQQVPMRFSDAKVHAITEVVNSEPASVVGAPGTTTPVFDWLADHPWDFSSLLPPSLPVPQID